MVSLYVVTGIALVASFFANPQRTKMGLKKGWMKFIKSLPNYLMLLMLISFVLLVSENFIIAFLGQDNVFLGLLSSLLLGSITIMPGFIAYPLAKILVSKGVPYMVVAGFVTSLMLVGLVTYPLEKEYFGRRATILRNVMSFTVAAMIAIIAGIAYGEVFL
ncbi:MAG: hypothetical protein RBT15_07170 [Gudongella sp.]|jgi:uncharacterized membrane protein YraQ (UPF0718 family)|nr:hypothetical protein [Gudongella sp.]